jgi:hypothetical protein
MTRLLLLEVAVTGTGSGAALFSISLLSGVIDLAFLAVHWVTLLGSRYISKLLVAWMLQCCMLWLSFANLSRISRLKKTISETNLMQGWLL